MTINELSNAGLTGWPLALTIVGLAVCFVSLWCGWPWEGIITIHKHYKDEDEDDE